MKGFPLTDPEVFVIDALHREDYNAKRADGEVLSNHLHLMGMQKKYYLVHGKSEFQQAIADFNPTFHVRPKFQLFSR